MNAHFIAPLPALRKRTRLVKMASTFVSQGIHIDFHGWERVKGEATAFRWCGSDVLESIILTGGGYASSRARIMYPLWMLAVFFRTLKVGRRQTIFCLGWETAFPALIAAKLTGSNVIFDDADRFSLIIKLPPPFRRLLCFLERWVSRQALIHVVPSFSRYEWKSVNMLPLRNTPLRADFEAASAIEREVSPVKLTIYANGWLGETRGAPVFLELANRLYTLNLSVRFLIAGRVDSLSGEALIAHPLVTYYGEVDQVRALALYRQSDVVLTYYDPRVIINRKAESNKWGDCVYFGVPFIVNSEVETARQFTDAKAAFALDYDDVDGLLELVTELLDNPSVLRQAARSLAAFKSDYPIFDDQLLNIIKKMKGN